ncbi:hypothetical protein ACS0TY_004573 [Phlomoides rotata]
MQSTVHIPDFLSMGRKMEEWGIAMCSLAQVKCEKGVFIEKMDGYNQYTWNQSLYQNDLVYPPQYEEFGYDNCRNFDYNYQMFEDLSNVFPRNDFQTQHNLQPHQEYNSSVYSSSNE